MDKLKVYVTCCKKDYYFTKICIASIRYWNPTVFIYLLKDLSQGDFDTAEMEKIFNVRLVDIAQKKLYGYIKLQPFMGDLKERILLSDSDIVWLGDMEAGVKDHRENIIFDSYSPDNPEEEMNRWYFNTAALQKYYGNYEYPGFLFNFGICICDTRMFPKEDFQEIIRWKDDPELCIEEVFACGMDQGIFNYLVARKINRKDFSFKSMPLQIWGYSAESEKYGTTDIKAKKDYPRTIHWFGRKIGLISFFPGANILKFYEKYYYSKLRYGSVRLFLDRLKRTVFNLPAFTYESAKRIYYFFRSGAKGA